jgi:hypothetical protein
VENFSYIRVEPFQHAVQLAAHPLVLADAEDLGDFVGGEAEYSQLTGALEDLVDGEMAPEDEVAAVLDLIQRVGAPQVDSHPVLGGKLGSQHPGPVIQARADDLGAEAISGGL